MRIPNFDDLFKVMKYMGARMFVAFVAVVQFPVVVYATGAGVLKFEGEVETAAALLASAALGIAVGVAGIMGRTRTDQMGKMPQGEVVSDQPQAEA